MSSPSRQAAGDISEGMKFMAFNALDQVSISIALISSTGTGAGTETIV
jgi:hypothetical protein